MRGCIHCIASSDTRLQGFPDRLMAEFHFTSYVVSYVLTKLVPDKLVVIVVKLDITCVFFFFFFLDLLQSIINKQSTVKQFIHKKYRRRAEISRPIEQSSDMKL